MDANTSYTSDAWQCQLGLGDEVWWNDPDNGIASGYFKVNAIPEEGVFAADDVIVLVSDAGSVAEAFAGELSPTKPEDLLPVATLVEGGYELIGHVRTQEGAIAIGEEILNEDITGARRGNVLLGNETLLEAWVLTAEEPSVKTRVRIVMDVDYENATPDLAAELTRRISGAIGYGLLTGNEAGTDTTVDEYSLKVTVASEPLTEAEIADYMRQRIVNGELDLDDFPVRAARYGLMDPEEFIAEMRERMNRP